MTRTFFGSWYVQSRDLQTPDEGKIRYYLVGTIHNVGGGTKYHPCSDRGFHTFDEAKAWVLQQPGATE